MSRAACRSPALSDRFDWVFNPIGALAQKYFAGVEPRFFHLLSLAAVAARKTKVFGAIMQGLESLDERLFASIPDLRKHAWMVMLVLSQPVPQWRRIGRTAANAATG